MRRTTVKGGRPIPRIHADISLASRPVPIEGQIGPRSQAGTGSPNLADSDIAREILGQFDTFGPRRSDPPRIGQAEGPISYFGERGVPSATASNRQRRGKPLNEWQWIGGEHGLWGGID